MPYKDPLKAKAWREANAEKLKRDKAEHYAANADVYKARAKTARRVGGETYRQKKREAYALKVGGLRPSRTPEQKKAVQLVCDRAKRQRDPERYRGHKTAYKARNGGKLRAATARRRATKIAATPGWSEAFFIEEAYDLAQRRSRVLGFSWHVDHVVPLRNARVCGLHVIANLNVIPGVENMRKNNRTWPGMP